jgi:hypothetical protein
MSHFIHLILFFIGLLVIFYLIDKALDNYEKHTYHRKKHRRI